VRFEQVCAGYGGGIQAVHNLTLAIHEGQFMGILGPSGSGKTTLLRLILGTVRPASGQLEMGGRDQIGYVPQLETVDWNFPVTAEEVVLMGRWAKRPYVPWASSEDREEAQRIMKRLGIEDLGRRHIRELSGGQQQRVFLARALVSRPRMLLLDEPTSGIDIRTRDEVLHLLHELNHEGITIVMTTHDLNSAAAHLPWLVCLRQRVIAEGPPDRVMTPEALGATYGAEIVVLHHEGMVFVGERPHVGHDDA
jgi:zinc/manganese transport system ATP-binding protein/zinc transport system ATP-binding protein